MMKDMETGSDEEDTPPRVKRKNVMLSLVPATYVVLLRGLICSDAPISTTTSLGKRT